MDAQTAEEAHISMELYGKYQNISTRWMSWVGPTWGLGMIIIMIAPISQKYGKAMLIASLAIPIGTWLTAITYGIISRKYYVPFYHNRFGPPSQP